MKAYLKRFLETLLLASVVSIVLCLGVYCLTLIVEMFGSIDVSQLNPWVCYSVLSVLFCAVVALKQS